MNATLPPSRTPVLKPLAYAIKLACAIVAAGATVCVSVAHAQSSDNEQADTPSVERIQVIGSNIRGARAAGNLPVTVLDEEAIQDTGAATGDELLRSIPQIGDISFNNERTIGGVNDARGDVASINLRGIGTGNTLTLLNGRRLVLHPGTQTENFVPDRSDRN